MQFTEIINILENNTNLERTIVSLKNSKDTLSYKVKKNATVNVEYTVDSETITIENINQICFKEKEDSVYIYINYLTRSKYVKYDLNDVTNFSFS